MANRPYHDGFGALAGSVTAAYCARSESSENLLIECAGGALFGMLGSRLPDVFDPPTHPNHRSLGHGALQCTSAITWAGTHVPEVQATLRAEAARLAEAGARSNSDLERCAYLMAELGLRILSGAVPGALAGYASHLALDATTPKGLPLIR